MSQKPTVVLHGFTGSATAMAPLTSRLPGPVLALDLPGHGLGPVSDDPADYSMAAAVAGVVSATDHLEQFALVGYSMGGRVALHVASAHPYRVVALALIGARAGIDDSAERAERIAADESLADRIESEGIEWFADHWADRPLFATQRTRLPADQQAELRAQRLGCDPPRPGPQSAGHGGRSGRPHRLSLVRAVHALRPHRGLRRLQVRGHRPANGCGHPSSNRPFDPRRRPCRSPRSPRRHRSSGDPMRVELSEVSLKLRLPVMTGRGTITQRDGLLVRVTDGDLTGWGDAMPLPGWPGADLSATQRALEAWAANPDPDNLPQERFAHGAVELALLDLEARQRGRTQAEKYTRRGRASGRCG